jgi:hypothetical protein
MGIYQKFLVGSGRPSFDTTLPASPPGTNESDCKLEIAVIFTSPEATVAAIEQAAALLNGLNGRVSLVAAQPVPYPLPLENPPVLLTFDKRRLIEIASESPVETTVHLYLCRCRWQILASVLKPGSVVVIGGRKRWWPTWERSLARKLRRSGFPVIFLEPPEGRRAIPTNQTISALIEPREKDC